MPTTAAASSTTNSTPITKLKLELAEHICQYLQYEAQFSDALTQPAKDQLSVASNLIEQAYNIIQTSSGTTINNNNLSTINSNSGVQQPNISHLHDSLSQQSSNQQRTNTQDLSSPQAQCSDEQEQPKEQSKKKSSKRHSHHPISQLPMTTRKKLSHLIPRSHHHHHSTSIGGVSSVHQKNFKQRLIALIKKFRTDGDNFDSEEQYRKALERELMKATAGRDTSTIEELLEEDIDVEAESGSEQDDWDNVSEISALKPSLRPFFSSTTLDKI